jgi:hypothetical protein
VRVRRSLLVGVLWILGLPFSAAAVPNFDVIDGFLAFTLSDVTTPARDFVAVDVSVAPGAALDDVISWDLQVAWDPSYWQLTSIEGADSVERNNLTGMIDDLFGDVGTGPAIALGETLFRLLFTVTGDSDPLRTVLEIGDLRGTDPFFTNPVLVADSGFDTATPSPNARIVTPEPGTALLLAAGLLALALPRARR